LLALSVLARSPFGLTLQGIRDSESRMSSLGYSVGASKLVAVIISGLFAGAAGVLAVWNSQFVSPSIAGFSRSALAVIVVILGGTGTLLGPLVGAGVVVGAEHVLSSYVERWPAVLGLVFILVVLFAPRGIVGELRILVGRVTGNREKTSRSHPQPLEGALKAGAGHRSVETATDPVSSREGGT
jgi:branched-chain amino acid transport system permease protein